MLGWLQTLMLQNAEAEFNQIISQYIILAQLIGPNSKISLFPLETNVSSFQLPLCFGFHGNPHKKCKFIFSVNIKSATKKLKNQINSNKKYWFD